MIATQNAFHNEVALEWTMQDQTLKETFTAPGPPPSSDSDLEQTMKLFGGIGLMTRFGRFTSLIGSLSVGRLTTSELRARRSF